MEDTGFKRKKVEAITLGERIRKLRSEYRMSFAEISRATKIPMKYLEYLERAEYDKLPADVYVRGYLRSYARHLGLPEEALIKLYEKEQHISRNLGRERSVSGVNPRMPLQGAGLVVTSKELVIVGVALILFVIGVYLYREYQSFVSDPYLVVTEPVSDTTVHTAELMLLGKADARAVVTVNEELVPVGTDGSFSERLVLRAGQNTIVVSAKNRFDKEKKITVSVNADIAVEMNTPVGENISDTERSGKTFPIELSARGGDTRVTVEVDGALVYSGLLDAKTPRTFSGTQKVKIRSDKGSSTWVKIGGNPVEALSSGDESAEREFLAPNL